MLLDRESLCALIPHSGDMCLLDGVSSWDDTSIHCTSLSHMNSNNPLFRRGQLWAVNLIEYGAQAMAVHGGLLAQKYGESTRPGYLASVRDVQLQIDTLDDIKSSLDITANQLAITGDSFMYEFEIAATGQMLVRARAMVIAQPAS